VKRAPLLVAIACTVAVLAVAQPAQTADDQQAGGKPAVNVTGKWLMTLDMAMGTATPALELKQEGERVTGTYTGRYGTFPLEGSLKGRTLVFAFTMTAEGQTVTMSFQGEVSADASSMKGTATLGEMGDATWTAKRQ
jgi:hypothetical protein